MTVRKATEAMLERYAAICATKGDRGDSSNTGPEYLFNMCVVAMQNIDKWPLDKSNRWLGYIQGVLTCKGLIDVNEERDFSRPLFHEAYRTEGHLIPPIQDIIIEQADPD